MPQKMRRLVIAVLSLCSCSLTPTVVKHEDVMGLDNQGQQRASVTLKSQKKKKKVKKRGWEYQRERNTQTKTLREDSRCVREIGKARQRRKEIENESLTE